MKKQLLALLAVVVVATGANAAVSITGEGALGFISEGKNSPLGAGISSTSGFYYGNTATTPWFNNSVYIAGEVAKDTLFYSELQLDPVASTFIVNELNVSYMGLKLGRFTAPFGYYVPNSVYSAWNKLQRLDQLRNIYC
jgi:hypothetical protein